MPKYRIHYDSFTKYHIDIEADDIEQAREFASNKDGGDFTEEPLSSDWEPREPLDYEILE